MDTPAIGTAGSSTRGRVVFTAAAAEMQARAGLDPTSIYVWSDDARDIIEMSRAVIAWEAARPPQMKRSDVR